MKTVIASALILAATSASAVDFTILGERSYGTPDRNALGLRLSQPLQGGYGVEAQFDRYTFGDNGQNKYSLGGTYDAYKSDVVTVSVKAGGSYLDNQNNVATPDGYAFYTGVGLAFPVTKELAIVGDYKYQRGEQRVQQFNGSTFGVGLKYSF